MELTFRVNQLNPYNLPNSILVQKVGFQDIEFLKKNKDKTFTILLKVKNCKGRIPIGKAQLKDYDMLDFILSVNQSLIDRNALKRGDKIELLK